MLMRARGWIGLALCTFALLREGAHALTCEETPTCCIAGTYYDTSTLNCVECNENTFKPFDGEHTCMPCPAHTSCPHTGCVSCIPDLMDASIQCPDDQFHVAGDYIAQIKTYV